MPQEIELKLALPEEEHRHFLRHPLLRQAACKQSYRLINLYYDTPTLDLFKCGIALRLRAQGQAWLQTVKCAGTANSGLAARPEWEAPYTGHFDFSAIDDPAVRDWLERPKIRSRIAPIFETSFQRTAWTFETAPAMCVEMVLDRGWIAASGRRQAISEVEIELLSGSETKLFELARVFAERIPLAPAPLSKAERGYRLFKQVADAPVKAVPIPLSPDDTPLGAFRSIALACLDHLQRNHLGASTRDDPEYIHQMRVATRRLRAALRLFGPLLPADFGAPLLPALRELMLALGHARDLDVLHAEIAEPVLRALPDEPRLAALVGIITERRFAMRQEALQLLRSPRYGGIVLQALATVHGLAAEKLGAGGAAETPLTLREFAENRLRRLRKQVLQLASQASVDNPPSLHVLRICIKRLRYALEFFAPLAPPKATQRLLGHLAILQDTLGQINDLANAGTLLMDCAGDDPRLREAVTLIGGWHGPRHQKLLAAVPGGLKHLGKLRLPELLA